MDMFHALGYTLSTMTHSRGSHGLWAFGVQETLAGKV